MKSLVKLKVIAAVAAIALVVVLPSNVKHAGNVFLRETEVYDIESLSAAFSMVADSDFVVLADSIANLATADELIATAKDFIGVRYRWGHTGPELFDCSGFTSYVYRQNNIELMRTSRSQFSQGEVVKNVADLRKGDLVFFGGINTPRSVGHVGIVTDVDSVNSRFKFIHASRTGVQIDASTSSYYACRYLGARRILGNASALQGKS